MCFHRDVSCQLRLDDALLRAGFLLKEVLPDRNLNDTFFMFNLWLLLPVRPGLPDSNLR